MTRRFTLIIPAAESGWEVWSCTAGGGCVLRGTTGDPAKTGQSKREEIMVALPARMCRTLAFSAPVQDRRMVRRLAYAQLEKRGLAAGSPETTAFDCHVLETGGGRAAVSVDVVAADTFSRLPATGLRGLTPFARLFPPPSGKLMILEEQGRRVLCAGAGGRLLHSHILSSARGFGNEPAAEIRMAVLTLREQGLLPEITGLELHGGFSAAEAQELSAALALPVEVKPRAKPDAGTVLLLRRGTGTFLLPAGARAALRGRRRRVLQRLAIAAAAALGLLWWGSGQAKLAGLEKEAERLETAVAGVSASAGPSPARAAQERWTALRMALDSRRYPLIHLNALTRCLGSGGVVLGRFESKAADISVNGAARSAADAYTYFNAISQDRELGVFGWSMGQPVIAENGAAVFEIKGKMR